MAVLKAFRALRPTPEYASKVAALPYDVMNSDEARRWSSAIRIHFCMLIRRR